ncbi:MAG: hypothetical protein RIB86_25005, partial [Imperialibacter sp.]
MIGWYTLHKLSRRRDLENKRKDLRINYLIEAWKKLEYASNREITETEFIDYIEKPVALIQLFGKTTQINLAKQLANEIGQNGETSLNTILEELRNDLREELSLNKVHGKMTFIRYKKR